MTRKDTLRAALQLQRDASLLLSNQTVLHRYSISLHRTSTEVLHSMFGQRHRAGAPCTLCVSSYGGYWSLAAPGQPWWSRFGDCTSWPSVSGVSLVSSAAIRLVAGTCPAGLPLCTGVVSNLCCIYFELD